VDYYLNRSKAEEAERCLRAMWYTYHHAFSGIVKSPSPNYFDVGSAVHAGLAKSLECAPEDYSVEASINCYRLCPSYRFRMPIEQVASECLIEAIIRSWYCNGLEHFLQMYEVLYIEEEVYMVSPSSCGHHLLHWESRPDAIVRERHSPTTAAISWKTIDSATEWRKSFFRHDLQGLFEAWFGSQFLAAKAAGAFGAPRIDYIQTILFQKGKLRYSNYAAAAAPEGAESLEGQESETQPGLEADCFLVQAWEPDPHSGQTPFFNELGLRPNQAWQLRYWKPGNKSYSRLPLKNRRLLTPPEIGPWVHDLAQNKVFPTPKYTLGESVLDKVVIWEQAIMRSELDADSAIREKWYQHSRLAAKAAELLSLPIGDRTNHFRILEEAFPKSRRFCRYPVVCPHTTLCYDQEPGPGEVPHGFERRIPHHEREAQRLRAQGLL
jgi:hypothetical protein